MEARLAARAAINNYFPAVTSVTRVLAAMFALGSALAAPGMAFAHGFAHHEASEHASHHAVAVVAETHPAVEHRDSQAHGHQVVSAAPISRVVHVAPALATSRTTLQPATVVVVTEQQPPAAHETPPDVRGVPPAPSRAPPTL